MSRWKEDGFSQKKPVEPGVYFYRTDGHLPMNPPRRLREGWDVAEVRFTASGFGYEADAREDRGHWRLHTLSGIDRAWHKGMWLKGPLCPFGKEPA
jgi:hypothetical protein